MGGYFFIPKVRNIGVFIFPVNCFEEACFDLSNLLVNSLLLGLNV